MSIRNYNSSESIAVCPIRCYTFMVFEFCEELDSYVLFYRHDLTLEEAQRMQLRYDGDGTIRKNF